MNRIQKIVERLPGRNRSDRNADVVLGLPLESAGVMIYPVFLDSGRQPENGTNPRQIGYLEVSDDRSDFTSLESDHRGSVALLVLVLILLLVLGRSSRRLVTGTRGGP